VVQADMPRDVDFTYTRANIVGKPRYSSSSSQVRYTNALVSWSDPDNAYADAMEPAFIPELVSRYSFNQLEMTAIGCTRQSEAHRKGLWGILTNNKDRVVEFDVGLDGRIPQPGYIIALADELLAGRVNGGRISAVNGRVITLDRDVDAKPGDRLQLNLPSGISQSRTIQAVNGRRQITVTTAYSETPERECVWAVESNDLFLQQYRVTGVKENGDATLTITGVSHDPDKFARIDTGAIIDQRPVSVLPAGNQSPPDDIVITSRSVVNQGISVETMQVNWSAVSGAIAYEAQWRRNDGNWINVPRSSTTSFEVSGIYAGRYLVRVRAINAAEISSGWAYSEEKTLTGKVGEPLAPLALATRSLVHGVQVSWEFPTGSGDTLRTELQYSKNQDGSAPMPLSDVAYPGKSYQQMGLSMGAEFWYRARLVDRLGNESPWTGWVQGMASDNFDDYYENLTDAIKDTAAWEETQRTISETQEGIRNTQQELEQTAEALRKEAEDQAKQVSQDIDASAKSITADVDGKISAVNKTITDEITSVNEALDSGLAQANKGVQEAKSAVADANKQIATVNKSLTDSITQVRQSVTDTAAEINATIDLEIARVSKTLADGDAALNAQIKTAENGLKQSLSQVNTTLTNAVKQETADRIADVNAKAAQAADELLAATQGIEASIESLTQVMKTADENLAREMSSLAAGANIQFDSQVIWHFNNQTTEGWTGSAGVPGVSQDGWLRPADSATDPYITSPGGLAVDGAAYRFIMLRFRKTGKPVWAGEIRWVSAGENFTNTKRYIVAEPEYADGVATLTVRDIPWTGNIDRIRLDLTNQQDASNFIEFDWIAVGRPAPGASTAALQDVRSTLSNALTAEAQARSTLAAQMRGSYDGNDLEKVTSGLLYQEKTARVTAISAEVKARESLQTQFNDNKAAVSGELSSLTTEQSAQASRIGGLETSLGKKADAAALTSLTQKVEQQGATLTSQGAALTSLTNRVGQTETGLAGTNEALSGLQSVVTQQGDRITSQGQSITKLTSDLGTTNSALAKKAEAAAVTALTQQVEQNGRDIRSNTDSITSLSNQLVNGQPNSWSRRIYPVQLANAGTVPSFSDIRAVAPVVVDEVSDAAKLDFTSAGSYLIALYSCQVKVAADTTITMAPGNRIFDDTGAIFVNGVQVAWGNASWTTGSFELKVGWNTVEFLVNQWTDQAYINLGLKLSDKVAEMYSGLGVSALANAAGVLSSNVSQIGNDVVSNSQSITQLRNALTQTDANVASKADQTAMNSLTGRVEKTESGLTAANSNITSLSSSLSQQSKRGANLLPDGTFESYAVGHNLANNRAIVTTDDSHGGNKCIRVTRPNDYNANATDNTDTHIFSGFQVRDNAVFYMECWVKLDAKSTAMAENVQISVGLSLQYQDNSWQWPAVTRAAKDLSTAQWTKVSGYLKSTKSGIKQAMVRISIPNVSSVKAGNSFLIDDLVITEVTDAYNAQSTADANANAISTLDSTVSQQGDQITSQGNSITKLTNDLATTNNNVSKKADQSALSVLSGRVDQTESGLSSANSSITALNSSVRAGNATSGDLISNPTFDPEFSQMGFTVVSSSSEGVPANCPYAYVARIAARDHHPNFAAIPATLGDVYEMSALVACGTGSADFNLYLGTATRPSGSVGAPLSSGGNRKASATWQRVTWRFKITQGIVDRGFFRPFLQINQSSPFGTVWFVTDWHMRNVTAAQKVQDTADATAAAVDSLTTTVTQQGNLLTSTGNRTTQLENGLATTNAAVAKKADATAVQNLTNTVTQLGNDLTAANSAITKLTGNLANTDKALAQKADATALATLDTKVTQQGKTLESQSNSLTNLSNSLSQVAADIDASGQIPGNLVVNPSFERGLDGYTGRSTATSVVEVSVPHSGTRALKVDPGNVTPGQYIPFVQGRTYEIGVWVKDLGATTDNGAGNNKLRIGNSAGQPVFERPYNSGTIGSDWTLISGRWKATETAKLPVTLSNGLTAGSRCFDDFYVIDVTDSVKIDANASALSSLQNTVTQQGKDIASQSTSITDLKNNLDTTNANVAKKADAAALQTLQNTVTQQGKDIASASSSITSLQNNLSTTNANVAKKADATALNALQNTVTQQGSSISSQGNSITQLKNDVDSLYIGASNLLRNSDKSGAPALCLSPTSGFTSYELKAITGLVGKNIAVKTQYTMTLWFKEYADGFGTTKPFTSAVIGRSAVGTDSWSLRYYSQNGIVTRDGDLYKWVGTITAESGSTLFVGVAGLRFLFEDKSQKTGCQIYQVKLEEGNKGTSWSPASEDLSDAISGNSQALSSLDSRVTKAEGSITSQGNSITQLQNELTATNANVSKKADASALASLQNTVTQQGKDITSVSSDISLLKNSLATTDANVAKKADSSTLSSLQSTVTQQGKDLSSVGNRTTNLENNLKTTDANVSKKADASAVDSLQNTVTQQGKDIASQSTSITDLKNNLDTTNANVAKKADAAALQTLQNTVTQQGKDIASASSSITSLQNNLNTTNSNVSKKADSTALNALQNTVTSQGDALTSQGNRVTSLENTLTVGDNIVPNSAMLNNAQGWGGHATTVDGYPAVIDTAAWAPTSPKFSVTPGDILDFSLLCLAGAAINGLAWGIRFDGPSLTNNSVYVEALNYAAGEKKAVTGTITVPAGATTGYLQPYSRNAITLTIYNIKVTRRNAGTIANAKAIADLTNEVTQQGKDITSASSNISLLKNSLATTDANVAKKADSSALSSLQSTVNQQGTSISSIGNRTTSLENGLSTAQNNIARKADASALQDLRNTVTSQGGDLTAANSSITSLQASMNRRTVFTVTARGNGNSVTPGVFDESGKNLFTPGRSWALVTFAKQSDGSAVIATSKTYDVFGSANNGDTMSADIGALTSGTYVCVLTFDEPSGNRGKILSALESLGGTSEVVNSLPYRGAYILLGRKGMRSGDGLELRAPTGGDATAHISTSVEFVNGIMMGLGAAGGVMMKADANASAITTLQNTVKTQGGNIDSLSSSITALENSLRSTNDTVSKKADTTAVSSLTGRVSQVENTITSQSQSITSLTSSINTISTQGANPWVDGTFESYGDGHVLGGGGTAVVVASQKFTGNKSLQVSRGANDNGNSDKQLGSWQSVREDAKFRFEFWAMMPADQAPSSGWTTLVGIQSQNAAGQNAWQAAVTVSEASLGARDKWVKFTGIASNNGAGRTRAVVWISTRGATGNGTPGYSLYIDDLVITDVTDAKAAQDASDATASAVSGLTARVTDAEGKITAQAQQQTALASKVDNANSRVDNMAKTLSDSQSTQASLNTSLQSQIDAQAAANIKNQTTLDNTIKSVASITSTQQTHATALEALATQQTTLTSSVGDLSASVQNTAKTVADVNGTVSSLWSMKVETVNGKNVGAGITLGSNGETSDMILYADRFSLFNRNNATAVPVMVAEGNELYIDTARIKNSSLTSTKIADGSITNAKIGHEIRSNDFVDGSRGWRIAKDGSSQFNNVIVRGAVYATDGWFQGTVYANHIEGDIGSFAINIAQHRTRKVPKATWQWFELARFRRQNFDQVINIRGGLLQTDSITIDGGAKLRAGMSYAPGADGGLNPGYLSYAMLLRGTGATSGGGSMELGIELMYETGGATRLLTAQEEMNVDNMSFVVPAGSGDAVLRYGCYLDRNGQMVLTILSRFDAFAARNNNVIRGSST
ncbi:phage tail tip fiber protein, partial [Klebsiella pneumoniae]